jgi:hypothetical protein
LFRNHTGWRVLAAALGAGALIAAGGAAQASTEPAVAHATHSNAKTILVHVHYVTERPTAVPATPPFPSNCAYNDATCTYDSGWATYNNGGCLEQTIATWWGVPKNILNVTVNIQSPYLFSGCRAYATVYFGMNSGPPLAVGPFYSYACAEWDPTCSANQSWTYQVQQPVPQSQLTNLNSIYSTTSYTG